jgi:nuclear cap-binding protein subunit 1
MEGFNTLLKKSVDNLDWFKLKQLVRFYGELVNANVILSTTYCDLLNDILADLTQPRQLQVKSRRNQTEILTDLQLL